MFALIALHVPIGVAMGLMGFATVGILIGFGPAVSLFGTQASDALANEGLAVVAMFLLMGSFAGRSGLSRDLYRIAYAFIGHWRGGLAMATIGGCAGFGAVCGSSIATTATMTRVALPEMEARGYRPSLAAGSIAAGGTLGMLIPPSVVMIIYGILTEQFIIALFAAAIVPGLLSVLVYLVTIRIIVHRDPEAGPPGPRITWHERLLIAKESWAVIVLAVAVSGGIYSGIVTVIEAASVGAGFAFILSLVRGRLTWKTFLESLSETAANTALIYLIIIGASIFSFFMTLSGMPDAAVSGIESLNLPPFVVLLMLYLMFIILGSIFDTVAAMVITLPFVFPLVVGMGFDPIWWGVINVVVMEIGMITPPIGMNVFVMHGMARHLPLKTIFAGIAPFVAADLVRLALLTIFPTLALWLPTQWGMI